jgi:pimeloyl-ACP methyl ester carboxylesterase
MAQLLATSPDGTSLSCESHGQGRALVIVSGALFPSERWLPVVPLLAGKRRLVVLDRRGRGKSGDTAPYAPEREVEDILAVLTAIGEPLDMLGHSSGAILALQAAARGPAQLERLIAYEPPVFFNDADGIAPDLPERLDALLAAGDSAAVVATFLREGPRPPEAELSGMQASKHWPALRDAFAHTVPYDSRVQRSFSDDTAELARIRIPTLMLMGGASPERMQSGARTIAARLPNAQLRELPGEQHVAQLSAPALFASTIEAFLS